MWNYLFCSDNLLETELIFFSFLWGILSSKNHRRPSKPHEGMGLMYKHIDMNIQSYMPLQLAAFLWACIQNITNFVKENWLHFAERSFFSIMKWQGLRLWHSRALNHFCDLKYLCNGFAELKLFSALGKAPGLPWAAACLTARVFSAVELCLCNSVRLKNESNLKISSDWHLPLGWPGSAGRTFDHGQPVPSYHCLPWAGAVLGGQCTRQGGRKHLVPLGRSVGETWHYGEAGEGKAIWTSARGWGGAWSQWGEK